MNREQMIQRQQELLNLARAEQRELTAEEQAEFDSLQRSIEAFGVPAPANAAPAPVDNTESVRAAERQRCAEITTLCREFSVSPEDQARYLGEGTTVDAVRAAILDGMMQNGAPIQSRGVATVTVDAQDKFRSAAADALLMRSGMQLENPADGARQMMGMSLRDLAIECLATDGHTGLNRRSSADLFLSHHIARWLCTI